MKQKELITTLSKYPGNKDVKIKLGNQDVKYNIEVTKDEIVIHLIMNTTEEDKPSKKIKIKKEDETKSE